MIEFKALIALYSFVVFTIVYILLRYTFTAEERGSRGRTSKLQLMWIVVLLLLLILPRVLHMISYYGSFEQPDPYEYLHDSRMIIQDGSISIGQLGQSPYYRSFPIFTLLITFINVVTNLNLLCSYYLFFILSLTLECLFIMIILLKLDKYGDGFIVLVGTMTLLGNTYLYASFGTFAPYQVGLLVLLMLLYSGFRRTGQSDAAVSILLYIFALVHFMVMAVYTSIILTTFLIAKSIYKRMQISVRIVVLPLVIWLAYTVLSYALTAVYMSFFLFVQDVSLTVRSPIAGFAEEGVYRPLAIINAIGPSLNLGITVAYSAFSLYLLIAKKMKHSAIDIKLSGLSFVAVLFSIPSLWRYAIYGRFALGSYFMIITLQLMTVVSSSIVQRIYVLGKISRKIFVRFLSIMLLILLALGAIGGLLDPWTFKTPDNSLLLDSRQIIGLNKIGGLLMNSSPTTITLMARYPEQTFASSVIRNMDSTIFIKGLAGPVSKRDIEFDNFLNEPSRYRNTFAISDIREECGRALDYCNIVYYDGYYYLILTTV